jgi:hypothetical protein
MNANVLICVTSCNRLTMVRRILPSYIDFCNRNKDFHLLLALDGKNKAYEDFCADYQIPLLWSDEREGVGLSKNRVLSQFPDYNYYFFIEDDVELLDETVFSKHLQLFNDTGISHFIITNPRKIIRQEVLKNDIIIQAEHGSSHFAFYCAPALKLVGGWHTAFSKYKRFGHTEHTYRFYFQQLTPAPFNVIEKCKEAIIIHAPPPVTYSNISNNEDELIDEEQAMIDHKQDYFPLTTLSPFHYNQIPFGFNGTVEDVLKQNSSRYPLLRGREKLKAMSDYYFHLYLCDGGGIKKNRYFMGALLLNPLNALIKHRIKQLLGFVK